MNTMIILIVACLIIVCCLAMVIFARIRMLNEKLPKRARIMKACATIFALMAEGFAKEAAMEYAVRDIGINSKEELDEVIAAFAIFQEKALKHKKSLEYRRETA